MNTVIRKIFIVIALFSATCAPLQANELEDSTASYNLKTRIPNFKLRFMLRSDAQGEFSDSTNSSVGFGCRPAMLGLGFDMGRHFSFFGCYRFDFPTAIQKDGIPESLLECNLQYKPNDNIRIVVGKQMILHGSWEFDYNPINIIYYSLMGNYVQGYLTGAAMHYSHGNHKAAMQVSKTNDADYLWNDSNKGWNVSVYYAGDFGNELFKPIWSYTYTYSGDGRSLHNAMLGNQFNIDRVKIETDFMIQNALRHYGEEQSKTFEYSSVSTAEYHFPRDRFVLGGKYAYDRRKISSTDDNVIREQTISLQLRYLLSKLYGIKLFTSAAYRISDVAPSYRSYFTHGNTTFVNVGFIWDFTLKL